MNTNERDECILRTLKHVRKTVARFAKSYGYEREDLMQDMAILIMEQYDTAVSSDDDTIEFLVEVVRLNLINLLRENEYEYVDEYYATKRRQALYTALYSLSSEQLMYLSRAYHLNFTPITLAS